LSKPVLVSVRASWQVAQFGAGRRGEEESE